MISLLSHMKQIWKILTWEATKCVRFLLNMYWNAYLNSVDCCFYYITVCWGTEEKKVIVKKKEIDSDKS